MTLDPVDYAIISQALIAAAREMGVKLVRSAYSTVLREARDGSAALLDAQGNTVAQAELIPMQLGTIGHIFQPCAALYPVETLKPGDFFAINDPYSGGQHLQDVFLFHPIFHRGRVLGFSASVAHHLDLGGGSPGLNPLATDVWSEGLIIPPLRLNMARDWHGGMFERLLRANVRVPHQTMGDFDAQMAANAIGMARVEELADCYGAEMVAAVMAALQDYSEMRMRAAIRAVPDGVYTGEDAVDDDGDGDSPLPVRATVTVRDDTIAVDFTGTAPQVRRNLNAPFASTMSAALSCVKAVLTSPDIPFNAGAARPVRITAPRGSLLNPNRPAPVRARMEACFRAWNASGETARVAAAARRWVETLPEHATLLDAIAVADTPESVLALLRAGPGAALLDGADTLGRNAAFQAGAIVAATPSPALDALTVGWRGVRLVRQVAAQHGMRPGLAGTLLLLQRTALAAASVAATQFAVNAAAHAVVSHPLLRHLLGDVAGAGVAARRMIVLARATATACSPLPPG